MSASTSSSPATEHEQCHFVPDEICIAVTTKDHLDVGDQDALYREVSTIIDRAVGPGMIVPLDPDQGRSVTFLHDKENGTIAHLHFRSNSALEHDIKERNRVIRALVLGLNHNLVLKENETKAQATMPGDWRITAVMPHWIGAACQEGNSDGPAAPPVPVLPLDGDSNKLQDWRFIFSDGTYGNDKLHQYVVDERALADQGAVASDVVVAIIDTSPTKDAVAAAANKYRDHNPLLRRLAPVPAPPDTTVPANPQSTAPVQDPLPDPVLFEPPITSRATNYAHLNEIMPNWIGRLNDLYGTLDEDQRVDLVKLANLKTPNKFGMPDHGLFTTGIIKDIAPTAEIHLVRALSDTGLTDLLGFTDTVIRFVLDWEEHNPEKKLILCLSVTFGAPSYEQFVNDWQAEHPPNLNPDQMRDLHGLTHKGLYNLMTWLESKKNVLVVAAVGNSDPPEGTPDAPRFPAGYHNVLGVAALNRDREKAAYTNRGSEEIPTDKASDRGIATFGGDIVMMDGKPEIKRIGDNDYDAVRGVFSADALPHGGGDNSTGWVYWVGTSFAAPIVAGLAAVLWKQTPDKSAKEMIDEIQKYAVRDIKTRESLYCNMLFAKQELA